MPRVPGPRSWPLRRSTASPRHVRARILHRSCEGAWLLMARSHGRIMASIWSDPDFIAMRATAQRMFMFLLSQPDLSHAGLVPMRVNRWAKKAEDTTPKAIRSELDYLAERDFVVVDEIGRAH